MGSPHEHMADERMERTLESMMRARGLERTPGAALVYADATRAVAVVAVERLTVAALREHVVAASAAGRTGLVFVTTVAAGAIARQAVAECAGALCVETFTRTELAFDLMAHELVPRTRVLSDDERVALLARYRIRAAQLPRMMLRDPCARYLNLARGAVVCVTRRPSGADAYDTYRVVA